MAKVNSFIISICGASLVDASMILSYQPTMIGLIFVPGTPRCISAQDAAVITILAHKAGILVKGVFQDQPLEVVLKLSKKLDLDYVQLHGHEDATYCSAFTQKVIKKIQLEPDLSRTRKVMNLYSEVVELFLFDRPQQGRGAVLPFDPIREIATDYPILLAGGLNPQNVTTAIPSIGKDLQGVDVSTGVEAIKGRKDSLLVSNFITKAQEAYAKL